ncbi:MAG: ATP-binding protein [Siculibacillus sp.]|nr:ATP-binding protein [Siculibacillus sp.]
MADGDVTETTKVTARREDEVETAPTSGTATGAPGGADGTPLPEPDEEAASFAELAAGIGPEAGMVAVIDALDDPCILIDAAGIVVHVNGEARARYPGVRAGDPLVFRLRHTVLHDAFARVVADGRPETVEWQEKVPTDRWLEAHLAPVPQPGAEGPVKRPSRVLLRIEDLTETRRVERMRADFVANASHELRTPLTAVIGFLETLQGPARDDAKVRDRFLDVMAEQAGRMKRLIDDLLSLSRLEMRAHVRPEATVDLCEILRHVCDLVTPAATGTGVVLALSGCEAAQPARGEREELVQVFTNLVENAVKYGTSGGRVEIAIATEIGDARHVVVSVRDFGEGIDPVHLPRLTERFYRAHTEKSGATRGTGLGLAIVKHIVTRHGGRLTIESVRGEGSTFSVRLDRPTATRQKGDAGQ